MTTYYSVKLNVPHSQADAIRSLVPDGEPMSGTLIGLLLDIARSRGVDVPEASDTGDSALETRVAKVEQRLDALTSMVVRP